MLKGNFPIGIEEKKAYFFPYSFCDVFSMTCILKGVKTDGHLKKKKSKMKGECVVVRRVCCCT